MKVSFVDSKFEEIIIFGYLIKITEWGFPMRKKIDDQIVIKSIIDKAGKSATCFQNKTPGMSFIGFFLSRHSHKINIRLCQNIKKNRAAVDKERRSEYFSHLEHSLQGDPPSNIINSVETKLSDDPGRIRGIFKRENKYPEMAMNFTKSSISIMFAGTASRVLLPYYVVYQSENTSQQTIAPLRNALCIYCFDSICRTSKQSPYS